MAAAAGGGSDSPLFGFLVSGHPMATNFVNVGGGQRWMMGLPSAERIHEFMVVLLFDLAQVPANRGFALWYDLPQVAQDKWVYIGAVTPNYPSASFRAPWISELEAIVVNNAQVSSNKIQNIQVRLAITMESFEFLQQQTSADSVESQRALESAKGMAQHCFNYCMSFQGSQPFPVPNGYVAMPVKALEQWFQKFSQKHSIKPFFWMKKNDTIQ